MARLGFLRILVGVCFAAGSVFAQTSQPRGAGASAGQSALGKTVYAQRCEVCHYSVSTAKKIGPGLKNLYARRKFTDGTKVSDARVLQWIEEGGTDMPGYKDVLKSAEIRALVAYVKSL